MKEKGFSYYLNKKIIKEYLPKKLKKFRKNLEKVKFKCVEYLV